MFKNPGATIKKMAKVLFYIGVIAAILVAIVMIANDDDLILAAPLAALAIVGVNYISCLFLAAFGELVETNTAIKESNEKILTKLNEN